MSRLLQAMPFSVRMCFLGAVMLLALYLDFGVALMACGATGSVMMNLLEWEKVRGGGK